MDSSSTFEQKLAQGERAGWLPRKQAAALLHFFQGYVKATRQVLSETEAADKFSTLLDVVHQQLEKPFIFSPYHQSVRSPFDYYAFGNDFIRPLVDIDRSTITGDAQLQDIHRRLSRNENVIFLANHQIEADPQAISILLDARYPTLAEQMIFVAGERVVIDPLAVPFSMGRNLLCIYSKRYIDHPPERKMEKQLHNQRTMELMRSLLHEGGKCIYVAPSGGRDRPNGEGVVEVAPFDETSVEMFYLMAKKSNTPTLFYPMSLMTYPILPPPRHIQVEIGETRLTERAPIHLTIGPSIDMEQFPGSDLSNKQARRKARAHHVWMQVQQQYLKIVV